MWPSTPVNFKIHKRLSLLLSLIWFLTRPSFSSCSSGSRFSLEKWVALVAAAVLFCLMPRKKALWHFEFFFIQLHFLFMVWCQLLTSKEHLRSEERGFLARPQLLRKLWSMPTLKDGDETHESNYDGNQHFARASSPTTASSTLHASIASSWIHDQRPNRLITNVATIIDYQYANSEPSQDDDALNSSNQSLRKIESKLLHFNLNTSS